MTELQLTPSPGIPQTQSKTSTGFLLVRIAIGLLAGITLLVAAAVVALPFAGRVFEVKAFRSPTSSMCPTICLGRRYLAPRGSGVTTSPART